MPVELVEVLCATLLANLREFEAKYSSSHIIVKMLYRAANTYGFSECEIRKYGEEVYEDYLLLNATQIISPNYTTTELAGTFMETCQKALIESLSLTHKMELRIKDLTEHVRTLKEEISIMKQQYRSPVSPRKRSREIVIDEENEENEQDTPIVEVIREETIQKSSLRAVQFVLPSLKTPMATVFYGYYFHRCHIMEFNFAFGESCSVKDEKRSKRKVRKVIALMIQQASESEKLLLVEPPYESGEFDAWASSIKSLSLELQQRLLNHVRHLEEIKNGKKPKKTCGEKASNISAIYDRLENLGLTKAEQDEEVPLPREQKRILSSISNIFKCGTQFSSYYTTKIEYSRVSRPTLWPNPPRF